MESIKEGPAPLILVVDDEESNILVFKRPLTKAGYSVITASSGKEALRKIEENEVDVILLDWMMPEMSGLEVCRRLKKGEKSRLIPIIMVTAKSHVKDLKEGLGAGADDYVSKPVNMDEVMARLRAALRQRRLEKELDDTNTRLRELMALKDEFLNIASHDLRSPLNSIIGFTKMLLRESSGPLTEKQKRHLQIIEQAGERQLSLVNDLLDLAKIETGKEELALSRKTPEHLLDECYAIMRFNAQSKGIELVLKKGCERAVDIDEAKILRVVNNLVSNAIKFTPQGGRVELSCADGEEGCMITVKDSGVGIKKEEIPNLFGKFAQLSSRATAGEKGSGLGLSIARNIVELHGGKIWAESEEGKGSSFHVFLPFAG